MSDFARKCPMGSDRSPALHFVGVADRLANRIERWRSIDPVAARIHVIASKATRHTTFAKDVLSGTGLGHAAHPALVIGPLGCWASALTADLTGERRAATHLTAAGIALANRPVRTRRPVHSPRRPPLRRKDRRRPRHLSLALQPFRPHNRRRRGGTGCSPPTRVRSTMSPRRSPRQTNRTPQPPHQPGSRDPAGRFNRRKSTS